MGGFVIFKKIPCTLYILYYIVRVSPPSIAPARNARGFSFPAVMDPMPERPMAGAAAAVVPPTAEGGGAARPAGVAVSELASRPSRTVWQAASSPAASARGQDVAAVRADVRCRTDGGPNAADEQRPGEQEIPELPGEPPGRPRQSRGLAVAGQQCVTEYIVCRRNVPHFSWFHDRCQGILIALLSRYRYTLSDLSFLFLSSPACRPLRAAHRESLAAAHRGLRTRPADRSPRMKGPFLLISAQLSDGAQWCESLSVGSVNHLFTHVMLPELPLVKEFQEWEVRALWPGGVQGGCWLEVVVPRLPEELPRYMLVCASSGQVPQRALDMHLSMAAVEVGATNPPRHSMVVLFFLFLVLLQPVNVWSRMPMEISVQNTSEYK